MAIKFRQFLGASLICITLVFAMATGMQAFAETGKRGGTLTVTSDTEYRNINPAMIASNGVFFISSKIIEPLAEMDYKTGFRPVLATKWQGSADGLSITFTLRDGVTWHDGKPFTSADVAFSAMKVWKPLQNLGRAIFADLEAVDTPDKLTAVFRFSKPVPLQLIENALPAVSAVLPKHRYEGTDIKTNPLNSAPVGTGPFTFGEHKPGEHILLERNPNYWAKGLPYLDRIIYRVMPDAGAKAAALETGDVHLTAFSAVPLIEMARLDAINGISVIRGGYEGITYQTVLEINHRRKELANPLVRQALRHAIDSKFIVDVVFLGFANAATGPVPITATDFYTKDVSIYEFNPARAEELLDQAGFPRVTDGKRFSLRLRPAPWFQMTRDTGDYVRQALQKVGIDVKLVTADPGGHIRAVYTDHDFDLSIGSPVWRNDPAISTTVLFQGGLPAGVPFTNQYGYNDPEMNSLIARAAKELNREARITLYHDFQRKVTKDLPILNLVDFTFITVARDEVRNVANNPRWATSSWADTWLAQ